MPPTGGAKLKRLTPPQLRLLERAAKGTWLRGSSEHQLAERLFRLHLIYWPHIDTNKTSSKIAAQHDGLIVLKQNGYYPPDPALRSSVRDPRAKDCSRCGGSGIDPEVSGCRYDCCGGTGIEG